MNELRAKRPLLPTLLVLAAVAALVAYYFWPRPAADADAGSQAPLSETSSAAAPLGYGTPQAPLPPGAVSNAGGIPVDAQGRRILNEAGLPISSEPLPTAKPIPIKATPGAVIGYRKDAQGNSQPIRAGDLKEVPNSPGTFAVVDMWADGGPAVVPATVGQRLSPQELAKLRAEEAARDRAGAHRP